MYREFDVVVTRCLKSGDWIAHALVYPPGKLHWKVLMETRDPNGYLNALQQLQSLAEAKLSGRMSRIYNGKSKFGEKLKGM